MIRRIVFAFMTWAAATCAIAASAPAAVNAEYALSKDGLYIANVSEWYQAKDGQYRIESDSNPAGVLAAFVKTRIEPLDPDGNPFTIHETRKPSATTDWAKTTKKQ